MLVRLKPPPQRLFADSAPAAGLANYLRFRLSPSSAVALAARVKRVGKEFIGDQRELSLVDHQLGEEAPYERLLTDAMAGDGSLFTREDAVEAAWAAVDRVLKTHRRVRPYKPGSWGPKEADALIARDGGWHNPVLDKGPVRALGDVVVLLTATNTPLDNDLVEVDLRTISSARVAGAFEVSTARSEKTSFQPWLWNRVASFPTQQPAGPTHLSTTDSSPSRTSPLALAPIWR